MFGSFDAVFENCEMNARFVVKFVHARAQDGRLNVDIYIYIYCIYILTDELRSIFSTRFIILCGSRQFYMLFYLSIATFSDKNYDTGKNGKNQFFKYLLSLDFVKA